MQTVTLSDYWNRYYTTSLFIWFVLLYSYNKTWWTTRPMLSFKICLLFVNRLSPLTCVGKHLITATKVVLLISRRNYCDVARCLYNTKTMKHVFTTLFDLISVLSTFVHGYYTHVQLLIGLFMTNYNLIKIPCKHKQN